MTLPSALWPSWIKPYKQLGRVQHTKIKKRLDIFYFGPTAPSGPGLPRRGGF
jgi:hypothetical protein